VLAVRIVDPPRRVLARDDDGPRPGIWTGRLYGWVRRESSWFGWARWAAEGERHEAEVVLDEERRAVLRALAALPMRRKQVLVLRYYFDLSEEEIARTLRISRGTVQSTAARALASLAKTLGDQS